MSFCIQKPKQKKKKKRPPQKKTKTNKQKQKETSNNNKKEPQRTPHPVSPKAALQHSIISRLVGEGFVVVSWGRDLLPYFSGGIALVEMHLQGGSGAGLGVAALLSTGHCLAHWGGSSCCVWRENGFALFSHLWSGKCLPPLFSELSQTGRNDPSSSLVSLGYPSSPCLCHSCPPAKWRSTPVFYLRHSCVSKPHTSGTPEEQTHADPLEEGFPALWLVLACRRRQWLQHTALQRLW